MEARITFVVEPNGRAILYADNSPIVHVDECKGYDEAMSVFNKEMEKRHLSYRLALSWGELLPGEYECKEVFL